MDIAVFQMPRTRKGYALAARPKAESASTKNAARRELLRALAHLARIS